MASHRKFTRRRGGAMVEMALTLLIFLVLIFAIFELGRGAWAYSTIAHATRQGARFAMIRGTANPATEAQIRDVVARHIAGLDPSKLQVTTTWQPVVMVRGGVVQVRTRYPFDFWAPQLVIKGTSVTLGATSRMIIAN